MIGSIGTHKKNCHPQLLPEATKKADTVFLKERFAVEEKFTLVSNLNLEAIPFLWSCTII